MSKWGTISGETYEFESLDIQHLKNIYWYHLLVVDNLFTRSKALLELVRRNDSKTKGASTPYIPFYDFEIEVLYKKGLIIGHDIYDRIGGDIIGHLADADMERITSNMRIEINQASKSKDSNQ